MNRMYLKQLVAAIEAAKAGGDLVAANLLWVEAMMALTQNGRSFSGVTAVITWEKEPEGSFSRSEWYDLLALRGGKVVTRIPWPIIGHSGFCWAVRTLAQRGERGWGNSPRPEPAAKRPWARQFAAQLRRAYKAAPEWLSPEAVDGLRAAMKADPWYRRGLI